MKYLLRVAFSSSLLITLTCQWPLLANDFKKQSLVKTLENSINQKNIEPLTGHLPETDKLELANRYKSFLKAFPNAKWSINELKTLKDGSHALEVLITADKELKGEKYIMKAKQILGIKTHAGKIIHQETISEETIIQNSKIPLSIDLNVPKSVLTGTYYDFDIVLNKPLGNVMIIGGLIPITNKHIRNQTSPPIELKPLGGGGLFKSVKAPLTPGTQNWAAVIAHPEGLISVTKMVKVVSSESDIEL